MRVQMAVEVISRAEARARGLKHYFTGRICPHGHISKRYVVDTKCFDCGNSQSSNWQKNNRQRCVEISTKWRNAHPEKAKDGLMNWRRKNPIAVKAMGLRFREKNREKARLNTQVWRVSDPERARKSRNASHARNPEIHRNHAKMRKAKVRGAGGSFTHKDLREIRSLQKNRCAECRTKFGLTCKATLDHIISIKNGGTNNRQNLQFLCSPCNSSKGASDPVDYARRKGRLI